MLSASTAAAPIFVSFPSTTPPSIDGQSYATASWGLFKVVANGADSVISIASNGDADPPVPLSAGGNVQLIARTIDQGGVLRAPMGQITFGDSSDPTATTTINLLAGSVTSVSADGLLIPYGSPLGPNLYIYGYSGSHTNTLNMPPAKLISFYGSSVDVSGGGSGKAAAKIDESGGGDLTGDQRSCNAGFNLALNEAT